MRLPFRYPIVMLIILVFCGATLLADTATFNLNLNNVGFVGSVGTISLSLVNINQIQVVVDLVSGSTIIQGGVGFNGDTPNDGGPTVSLVGALPTGYALSNGGVAELGNAADQFDGFGRFEYSISAPNVGSGNAVQDLTFTLSKSGGFASVFELVETDTHQTGTHPFAIHFFNSSLPAGANTGFASTEDGGRGNEVPEPSQFLGILAIGGFSAVQYWRRRRSQAA